MTELPAFDQRPECPKCGHNVVRLHWGRFSESALARWDPDVTSIGEQTREAIRVECDRCHYIWFMEPKDAPRHPA